MRVLLDSPSYLPATGGLEIHMKDLAGALIGAGAEVAIATHQQGNPDTSDPCAVHRWPMLWLPKGERIQQWILARKLSTLHRTFPFDILHAHSPCLTGLAALRVGRRLGIPVVYEMRSSWEDAAVTEGATKAGSLRFQFARVVPLP